MDVLKNITTK